jgi:hypothetical protein
MKEMRQAISRFMRATPYVLFFVERVPDFSRLHRSKRQAGSSNLCFLQCSKPLLRKCFFAFTLGFPENA